MYINETSVLHYLPLSCSTGCQCINGYYIRLPLPPLTVSMALSEHTSSTSACQFQTSLVGHTSVLLNAATCWFLAPKPSSDDGSFPVAAPTVWNSLPVHLSSTLISRRQFRDGSKSHLFADAYFWSSENIRYRSVMYLLTYLLTNYISSGRQWLTQPPSEVKIPLPVPDTMTSQARDQFQHLSFSDKRARHDM